MKKVMQQLGLNQQQNSERVKQLIPVTNIHLTANKHKQTGIKHPKKPKKSVVESDDEAASHTENEHRAATASNPQTVNIFNVDSFQVEGYQEGKQLTNSQPADTKVSELSVEDQAKKLLGSRMTFEKFGEKPLKNKQKNAAPDVEVPDEIRNHPKMQVP